MLPADSHVHSQWSWDALSGSMERSCERALALGLPSVAFTEHADFTVWTIPAEGIAAMPAEFRAMVKPDGLFHPPPFDVAGYAEAVERCRSLYPALRIVSGIELGEPHWHPDEVRTLLSQHEFGRIIGSVHSLAEDGEFLVVDRAYASYEPSNVVRRYLAEVLSLVKSSASFTILGHLDYPFRAWPVSVGPVDLYRFEEECRAVLVELAGSGRTLELNTRGPAVSALLDWWYDCGGQTLSFGSDAHDPADLAHDFAAGSQRAEAAGFRPANRGDFWIRGRPA